MKIIALYKVIKSLYMNDAGVEVMDFQIIDKFKNPISWNKVKYHKILKNSAPVKIGNRGSIFQLTPEEFSIIMDMVHYDK